MYLSCTTLADSYEKAVYAIVWQHTIVKTENGENTWQHEPMLIEITNPTAHDYIHKNSPYGTQFYEAYADVLVNGYKQGSDTFEYDYHSRLFEYYDYDGVKEESRHTNQIQYIIDKINDQEATRRAIGITWNPSEDTNKKDVPCLQNVQFWVSGNLLYMSVMFRSEDMLMGYPQNVYGLVALFKYMSEKTGYKIGKYYHYVTIPHLYNTRDGNYLKVWL